MKRKKSGGMISEDSSAPFNCPQNVMDKRYPENMVSGPEKMKDLYEGVQSAMDKDRAAFKRENEGADQFY